MCSVCNRKTRSTCRRFSHEEKNLVKTYKMTNLDQRPRIFMIGNAHLDPAWMWGLDEGFEAFLATCRSVLERIAETPGFIFTASSAAHYEFVEKTDPILFEKI